MLPTQPFQLFDSSEQPRLALRTVSFPRFSRCRELNQRFSGMLWILADAAFLE
jgi:hypothetical protein